MNGRSLFTAIPAAATAAMLLGLASPAWADDPIPGSAFCYQSDAADISVNPSYVDCSAHFASEGAAQPAPMTTLVAPFAGYGNFNFIGQTLNDNSTTGPFEPFGAGFGVPFGTLILKNAQSAPFIVALSSHGDYSLYLFDPTKIGGSVSSIELTTYGTTNWQPSPYELSYANLYAPPVPEPEILALMLAGLAATALLVRRRKT